MFDCILHGGTVICEDGAVRCDIGIRNGTIAALGDADNWLPARQSIDAAGKLVFPGMLDSHAHIASPGPFPSLDDYRTGTIAAACGGTTTIVDFAFVQPGETPRSALARKLAAAHGHSVIDYSFHPCINRADEQSFRDIEALVDEGFSSIKLFTVYRDSLMLEAAGIRRTLQLLARKGGLAMIHAENAALIEGYIRRDVASGHTRTADHPHARPPITELTAYADVIEMVRETGAPVLLAHMSTGQAAPLLRHARDDGLPVCVETCPHYLLLDEAVYDRPDGCKFVCNPPIRGAADRTSLWQLLESGVITVVNSDHTDFSYAQKRQNDTFYPNIPGGLPGIETRGMLLFSEAVVPGCISLERFAALTSTNIAKLMGLYPRKGVIRPGSDADLVVVDPNARRPCNVKTLHMQSDYSPYEGRMLTGAVTDTLVRGVPVVHEGRYVDSGFRGKLLFRGSPVLCS